MSATLGHIFFFFFNDTATTEIYTLSLHDALPICQCITSSTKTSAERTRLKRAVLVGGHLARLAIPKDCEPGGNGVRTDRKSTRLNSSHDQISYAVFCLKKKTYRSRYRRADRFVPL